MSMLKHKRISIIIVLLFLTAVFVCSKNVYEKNKQLLKSEHFSDESNSYNQDEKPSRDTKERNDQDVNAANDEGHADKDDHGSSLNKRKVSKGTEQKTEINSGSSYDASVPVKDSIPTGSEDNRASEPTASWVQSDESDDEKIVEIQTEETDRINESEVVESISDKKEEIKSEYIEENGDILLPEVP